jgi:TonB-linked SusC/RagA family outer membrane protein
MESFNQSVSTALRKSIDFDPEWEEYYNYSQNTNWIEEITRIAHTTQQNLSVKGGGEKARYNINVGYDREQGTTVGTGLDKLNIETALDYDISTKLTFITDVMYTRRLQQTTYNAYTPWYEFKPKVRDVAYRKMPNLTVYERDTSGVASDKLFTPFETLQGNAYDMFNPVAFAKYGEHNRNQNNTRAQFTLKYNMHKAFTYMGSITLDLFDQKINKFLPYEAIGANYYYSTTNEGSKDFSKKISILTMNRLLFKPALGDQHDLVALLKLTTEGTHQKSNGVITSKSASRNLTDPAGEVDISYLSSGSSSYRYVSTFFQLNYKFRDQHIFMASINAEGSSRYSADSRYGYFPAVSYAWRISNMGLLKNLKFLNDFRPRISWGMSGNSPDKNYLYFNSYSASTSYGYNGVAGIKPSSPELTGLEWETIEQLNPGLSVAAFNYRFTLEIDFYSKHTRNLYLENYDLPSSSGYTGIDLNDGEMLNRGWEVFTDIELVKKNKLSIRMNFNISHNENKVLRMPENYEFERGDMDANGNYLVYNTPGRPIGGFYGYDFVGVYVDYEDVIAKNINGEPIYDLNGEPLYMMKGGGSNYEFEPGDAKYKDVNYDGVIDQLDIVYLGDINPDFMGGFGPRIQYGNLTLNAFFHFKYGRQIINYTKMKTENMYGYDNQSVATKWAWRGVGDSTNMPRPLFNYGYNWLGSDRFVEDGSFMRLKTASVSYKFPEKICNILKVKELRTYITFYNLFTWTKYSGQDPDVAPPSSPSKVPMDESKTPPSHKMIFGLSFTF